MRVRSSRTRVETLIGRDTTVRGDIEFRGALVIEGRVTGTVSGVDRDDRLVLARDGVIEGSVELGGARIEGRVDGDVTATAKVEIGPHGVVGGTVRAAHARVHPGGVVAGAIVEQPAEGRRDPPVFTAEER